MKAGQVVVFVAGEYSDHGLSGVFKALKDFSLDEQLEAFLERYPAQRVAYRFDKMAFMGFLELNAFLEAFPVLHVSLGAYDCMPECALEQEEHDLRKEAGSGPEFPPWGAGGPAPRGQEAVHKMVDKDKYR